MKERHNNTTNAGRKNGKPKVSRGGKDTLPCSYMSSDKFDESIPTSTHTKNGSGETSSPHSSSKKSGRKKYKDTKHYLTPKGRKRDYKYSKDDYPTRKEKQDADRTESSAVHSLICRVFRDEVACSYDKRKLTRKQWQAMNALCGIRSRYCKTMLASDVKLRTQLGLAIIEEYHQLWFRTQTDPNLYVYHITPLSDKFQFSIHDGDPDVHGTIDKFTHAIRKYTDFNVFGVYEAQPIVGREKRDLETLYGHSHCIAYTRNPSDAENLIKRAKGFQAKLTRIPILAQPMGRAEGDFTRLGRYHAKPPYEAKKYNEAKFKAGEACLRGTIKGVEKYHLLRTLELQSKLPLENSLFGIGEGVAMKTRILRRVRRWHQSRSGKAMDFDMDEIYEIYSAMLSQNRKRLASYKPLNVKRGRC